MFAPLAYFQAAAAGGGIASTHSWDRANTDWASITDAAQTGLDQASPTFEGWFRFSVLPGSGAFTTIYSKWGSDRLWLLRLFNASGVYTPTMFGSTNGSATSFKVEWTTALSVDTWYHFAFSYDSTVQLDDAAKCYVNGSTLGAPTVVTGSGSTTYALDTSSTAPVEFGVSGSGNVDGYTDDFRLWDHVRSSGQINANKDTSLVGNESGLQALWKFDNDLLDSTANGNDLTDQGSAAFSAAVLPF